MKISQAVSCAHFPCADVNHQGYVIPSIDVDPDKINAVMIAEASPQTTTDDFYAAGDPLYLRTTLLAFNDAGFSVQSVKDILDRGIYLTTAVKCSKTGYAIQSGTVEACSHLLEAELAQFPNLKVILLMGDVAIKSLNNIARRNGLPRVIPAASTYKIRGEKFFYRGMRVFPSYLQAGPSFFIEKGKRKMIAEDIASAMQVID